MRVTIKDKGKAVSGLDLITVPGCEVVLEVTRRGSSESIHLDRKETARLVGKLCSFFFEGKKVLRSAKCWHCEKVIEVEVSEYDSVLAQAGCPECEKDLYLLFVEEETVVAI